MKNLGAALGISLVAHAAAGGFVVGWSGAAPEDQPGVIFAEIVYETSLENTTTVDRLQNTAAIKGPPVAPIEMTRRPIKSLIKLSELQPAAHRAGYPQTLPSVELPSPEPIIAAPTLPITSFQLHSSIQPALALFPDEIRRDQLVPRDKPPPPSRLSGATKLDEKIDVPMSSAKQTVTPVPEKLSNPRVAGGTRHGERHQAMVVLRPKLRPPSHSSSPANSVVLMDAPMPTTKKPESATTERTASSQGARGTHQSGVYETVVAALPPGADFIAIQSDASAPKYAALALGNQLPKYPYAARRRGMEGKVVIEAIVDRVGSVATATVVVSSGHSLLDRAALSAVKRWTFHPARRRGRAVGATVAVPITYALETESATSQE